MNRTKKRIILIVLAVAGIFLVLIGIMVGLRNSQKKPVNVYAVSDFAMTDYWGDSSETSGLVTTDKLQKVMISDTQKVNEIYVQEGQSVRKGDVLLNYDTTLSDLEVKKAEIELQRAKLELSMAEKELKELNAMTPYSSVLITPSNDIRYDSQTAPLKIRGVGTVEDPYYYLWDESLTVEEALYPVIFPEEKLEEDVEQSSSEQECYVVLLIREQNALNGAVKESWGLCLKKSGEMISMRLYTPDIPEDILQYDAPEESYYQESGSEYTAAELKQMRDEKAQAISDLKVAVKLAELEYKKMQSEMQDGKIISTIDGTVTVVRDPDEAYKNGEAVVEVSGGGGYYIEGVMSELEMGQVEVGQTVQINSWSTGTTCEGTITEIYTYPASNNYSYSAGNTNVSYYPFRVFVEESANLQENDYVNIMYQNQSQADQGMYLEKQFIRTQNGSSFVYVRNESGKLEKQAVQTGKDLYGSYTEIKSGITIEDYVAFPYGKNVFEGAKTNEATMDEFYGY